MAKSLLRLEARKLRSRGESVITITHQLGVSKSTASLWVRDIILTIEQQETLKKHSIVGAERGRLLGALKQKNERLKRIKEGKTAAAKLLGRPSNKEFFAAGIALYWAEGNKRMKKVEFCNSDAKMVVFFLDWFQRFFDLTMADFKCYVGINTIHREREKEVKEYWEKITGIPAQQFTKTSFKHSATHKIYDNFNEHYGTLSVKVLKPARILYKIAGLVEALRSTSMSG